MPQEQVVPADLALAGRGTARRKAADRRPGLRHPPRSGRRRCRDRSALRPRRGARTAARGDVGSRTCAGIDASRPLQTFKRRCVSRHPFGLDVRDGPGRRRRARRPNRARASGGRRGHPARPRPGRGSRRGPRSGEMTRPPPSARRARRSGRSARAPGAGPRSARGRGGPRSAGMGRWVVAVKVRGPGQVRLVAEPAIGSNRLNDTRSTARRASCASSFYRLSNLSEETFAVEIELKRAGQERDRADRPPPRLSLTWATSRPAATSSSRR